MIVKRVSVTATAAEKIRKLKSKNGELIFHQSGGCCDGSSPMCYPKGEFRIGERDVLLGVIEECEFYIGAAQYERWAHTHIIVDIVAGRGAGFSLEAPEGFRFLSRSRLFNGSELSTLRQEGLLPANTAGSK